MLGQRGSDLKVESDIVIMLPVRAVRYPRKPRLVSDRSDLHSLVPMHTAVGVTDSIGREHNSPGGARLSVPARPLHSDPTDDRLAVTATHDRPM